MPLTEMYSTAFSGLLVVILTWMVQWLVATSAKISLPGDIPGKIDQSLSHDSFVFRAHRTFMNSLENAPAILGASLLAILVGADVFWTGVLVWLIALARIVHMTLYYAIATEKNPSPRSYFFMIGQGATLALLVFSGLALV